MPVARVVFHVDLDAFYASVEQRDRPELAGKPVIVGADPQNGRGRGVVAASSYEARRFGVRSAMPITHAWRRCPHGVYLRPDFPRYTATSLRIMDLLREHAGRLEQASIDEAYLDVTDQVTSWSEARALAERLRTAIRERENLTASVGIGPNKLVAKIASDLDKPDGLTLIRAEEAAERLSVLPASRIPGIGPKTFARAAELGLTTIRHLQDAPDALLRDAFGSLAAHVRAAAHGRDDTPVDPAWTRKSVGTERTFHRDEARPDALRAAVRDAVRECQGALRRERLHCRTLTLKIRTAAYETHTRSRTLPAPIAHRHVLEAVAAELLEPFLDGSAYRLVGVRCTNLLATEAAQTTLDAFLARGSPTAVPDGACDGPSA